MKIISEFKNDLLKRKEYVAEIEANATPSMAESVSIIVKELKVPEETIAIKKISSRFGKNVFQISFYVYESSENKALVEPKVKKKKTEQQGVK